MNLRIQTIILNKQILIRMGKARPVYIFFLLLAISNVLIVEGTQIIL